MKDNFEKEVVRIHASLEGRVQGVGFRYFVADNAQSLNLHGWVRNRWDGSVEVTAEGERSQLENFAIAIQRGPRAAFVSNIQVEWQPATGEFNQFSIRATK